MMKMFLSTFALIVSVHGFSSEVELVWRKIDTQYSYKDANTQCSTKTLVGNIHNAGEAYLALEINGDEVVGGRFSNYPNTWVYKSIYKAIDLNPNEIASTRIVRDSKKQVWLKTFVLTQRLAKWLVHFPSLRHYWCEIPFVPQSVSPSSQSVDFETEGIEQGIEVSYSDWLKLEGKRPDGGAFEETIKLVQRKSEPWELP